MKKNYRICLLVATMVLCLVGCSIGKEQNDTKEQVNKNVEDKKDSDIVEEKEVKLIEPSGTTLATRIKVPEGYTRVEAGQGTLTEFIRNYEMKEDGSKVLLYSGNEKGNQSAHVAVFKLPIENYDLQQCADSIMRMYAEYYWNNKQYDKISFHFVSGFEAKYSKWIQGNNIKLSGNNVVWVNDSSCNSSYESFKKYLRMVFNYASTLSMDKESEEIVVKDIQVGDIFIKGGSPGHVVMVVDVCVNAKGKKAFLLAQGYMPAQEFHVLKNEAYENGIWYYEDDVTYPFYTPEYSFDEGSLQRPQY